ncbi:MAG: hypothetical protein AMXMBFR84_25940 [Candidatus Hydrogenedentota bacterium]
MKIRIVMNNFENKAREQQVLAMVEKLKYILPNWVETVSLCDVSGESNDCCCINCDPEYRQVVISLYPGFFEGSEEKQLRYLLHEFSHTVCTCYFKWCERHLLGFIEERHPEAYAVLKPLHTEKLEEFTQDLRNSLIRHYEATQ